MAKLKRPVKVALIALLSLFTLIIAALIVFILFINPIAHWAIEKYSPEYVGRQVLLRDIHIGLFSGKIKTNGVYILEPNRKDTLAYTGEMFVRIGVRKAIQGVYKVDTVGVDTLLLNVFQDGSKFNFDDLMARFLSSSEVDTMPVTDTVKYFVNNVIKS